jgi:hypothetical protein
VDKRLPKHNFRLANHPTVPSERITSVRTFDGIVASIFSFLKKQERAPKLSYLRRLRLTKSTTIFLFTQIRKVCEPNEHVYPFQTIDPHQRRLRHHLPAYDWCLLQLSAALKCPWASGRRVTAHGL